MATEASRLRRLGTCPETAEASSAGRPDRRSWQLHARLADLRGNAGNLLAHLRVHWRLVLGLAAALLGLDGDLTSLWAAEVRPTADSFGAAVYADQFWQGVHGAVVLVMALCLAARCRAELAWWIRCAASPSTMFACSACSGSTRWARRWRAWR